MRAGCSSSDLLELYREVPVQREGALAIAWTTRKLFLGHTVDYEMHDLSSPYQTQMTTLFTMPHSRPHILVMPDELLLVSGSASLAPCCTLLHNNSSNSHTRLTCSGVGGGGGASRRHLCQL